ncbi:MAG: DUF4212 domain-containing protein, partial [Alphaproteobacteria bacterium]|nr:DUF4212 domain-containing protein [Alphaproteobacteria bacterium]
MRVAKTTLRWPLHAVLLSLWFAASFGVVFFARDLDTVVAGWPVGFWFAAQGSVLVFIGIVVLFAWHQNRRDVFLGAAAPLAVAPNGLHRRFAIYLLGVVACLAGLGLAQYAGLPKPWIAGIFLSLTLVLYAAIGVYG